MYVLFSYATLALANNDHIWVDLVRKVFKNTVNGYKSKFGQCQIIVIGNSFLGSILALETCSEHRKHDFEKDLQIQMTHVTGSSELSSCWLENAAHISSPET